MVVMRRRARLTRRRFLSAAAATTSVTMLGGLAAPAVSRAADRPRITHGVQSGDISIDSGMVWARTDRPSRLLIDVATTESFADARRTAFVDALPESDFTAKALIEDLPPGQDIFYRVQPQDLSYPTALGAPITGRFRTAPDERRSISFAWSGDSMGWGLDLARGGMRTYATMRNNGPDFFIHSGDIIYADSPLEREIALPNGETWRNHITEAKSKVAETLDEFRGNYKYNLIDENLLAFNREVPIFAQWDDHEVTNDWWPTEPDRRAEYRKASTLMLAARGTRAFHEYMPTRQTWAEIGRVYRRIPYGPMLDVFMLDMRSYRGPNGGHLAGSTEGIFGPAQIAWLKRELARSRATWKVIAADMPLGLVSYDSIAQGDGPPQGRELELADLLTFIKRNGIINTVWITADVHYTAAHYYDPNRAVFQDFEPFWEFVSGPLHAGTGGPSDLDNTFGPQVRYQNCCTKEQGDNLAPCFDLQFFGHVAIDGRTEVMTVTLKDVADRNLWAVSIEPGRQRHAWLRD